jgi:hypothetical protein
MNRSDHRSRRFSTRIFLAGLLLLGLIATSFPLATLASAPSCTLACCAGLPEHAAGSCMGGSCHAGVLEKQAQPIIAAEADDELCGLARIGQTGIPTVYADEVGDQQTAKGTDQQVSFATLTKPCQPECGACAAGTNNSSRQRKNLAGRSIACLVPPLDSEPGSLTDLVSPLPERLSTSTSPRGPPSSFS